MKRHSLPGLIAAALLATSLGACGRPDRPPAPAAAGPMTPRAAMPTAPGQTFAVPPPSQAMRDQAALAAACRADADRVIMTRDRGQMMREDERDARIGTDASIFARRTETDRLGRLFERDRIAAECLQQNTRTPPQR
jgi:hypothetical protein